MGWTFSGRHGKTVTQMVKESYEWDNLTLKQPIRFTDGKQRGNFKVWRNGRKLRFVSLTDGATVRISKHALRDAMVHL
jgi:hypothetical protein